MKGKIVVF